MDGAITASEVDLPIDVATLINRSIVNDCGQARPSARAALVERGRRCRWEGRNSFHDSDTDHHNLSYLLIDTCNGNDLFSGPPPSVWGGREGTSK